MDAIISQVQDVFEGQIDFDGQSITDMLSTVLQILTSVVALLVGFIQRDIFLVLWIGLTGALMTMIIVVPAWPLYNQEPLPWIGSKSKIKGPHSGIVVSGVKVN